MRDLAVMVWGQMRREPIVFDAVVKKLLLLIYCIIWYAHTHTHTHTVAAYGFTICTWYILMDLQLIHGTPTAK